MKVTLPLSNMYPKNAQPLMRGIKNAPTVQNTNYEQKCDPKNIYAPAFYGIFYEKKPSEQDITFVDTVYEADRVVIEAYADKFTRKVLELSEGNTQTKPLKKVIKDNLKYLLTHPEMTDDIIYWSKRFKCNGKTLNGPPLDFQNQYLAFVAMGNSNDKNQHLVYHMFVEVLKENYHPDNENSKNSFGYMYNLTIRRFRNDIQKHSMRKNKDTIAESDAKQNDGSFPIDYLRQAIKKLSNGTKIPYTRPEVTLAVQRRYYSADMEYSDTLDEYTEMYQMRYSLSGMDEGNTPYDYLNTMPFVRVDPLLKRAREALAPKELVE